MSNKRLLILSRYTYPEGGGAELATHLILERFLSKIYSEITILSGTPPTKALKPPNTRIYYFKPFRGSKPEIVAKTLAKKRLLSKIIEGHDALYIPSNALQFIPAIIKTKKKTIIHLHDYQPVTYTSALIYNTKPSLKQEYLIEKYEQRNTLKALGVIPASALLKRLYLRGLTHADTIIVVSRRQKEILEKHLPSSLTQKIITMYNPLPKKHSPTREKCSKKPLLYTSGTKLTKGYPVLLAALFHLARKNTKTTIIMLQIDEKERKKLRKISAKTSVDIKAYPRLSKQALNKLYCKAKATLITSIHEEPLPYTLIESLQNKAIPVASRVGGIAELLENTPSQKYLFTPFNHIHLSEIIEAVENTPPQILEEDAETTLKILESKINNSEIEEKITQVFT